MTELFGADPADVTLLLVDDTPENLVVLEAILAPLGYSTLLASSGDEALRHLLIHDVAVILLDVNMPEMDGFETARRVKDRERTRDIPIVFLTAYGDDAGKVAEGFSSGAVDYLTKPIDGGLLRAKVQVLVDLHLRTRALQREAEMLSQRLDEQYAAEVRTLRKLTDAALVINSTVSLAEMLRTINATAREICNAHEAETILSTDVGASGGAPRARSCSAKYESWAQAGGPGDVTPLHDLVWRTKGAARMTAKEIEATFGEFGLTDVAPGHPMLEGWLAVPLVGRARQRLGLIQVADKLEGDFSDNDEVLLTQLAQLASVAIENAERYHQEHDIAETLQRSLLPSSPPRVHGVEVAVRYRPGGAGTHVGGDWYDVVPLDDGRVVLTVGDIMGRGARAAAVMGQLRTAMRAYAMQDLPPSVVMRSIDRLFQDVGGDAVATAAFLVLDPRQRRLEVVSAGHPPPLIVAPDGEGTFVGCDPHTPLGVLATPMYHATVMTVPQRALLVLYTDGLVEERDASLDDGLRRLVEAVDHTEEDIEALCDAILSRMVPGDKHDDIALLAARLK